MPKVKTTLLIDGDVLIYQVGLAAECPINWGDDLWTLHADLGECKERLAGRISNLMEHLEGDSAIVALSCSTESGFRRALCPTYKLNRKDSRKPVVHKPLRDHLVETYDTILRDRLEADDILGVLATTPVKGERRIIVSLDKDFRGVPCLFYRTCEDEPKVEEISRTDAGRFHAIQTLMGDRVDGYTGIPGVGPVKAYKMLDGLEPHQWWPAIVKAYDAAGLCEEVALTNARMARILQHSDYNTKTGEITLWTPSQQA
jgi:DNA polymerase I